MVLYTIPDPAEIMEVVESIDARSTTRVVTGAGVYNDLIQVMVRVDGMEAARAAGDEFLGEEIVARLSFERVVPPARKSS